MSIDYDVQLDSYLEELVPERPSQMQAMEAYAEEHEFPIIGPASGHLCYQIGRMIGARRVFELGSGYGYSTAWLARAVQENGGGEVYHVVWNQDLSQKARRHMNALGFGDIVTYRVGEAVQTLAETEGPFDLIFSDINKDAYPKSLPVIEEKLRPGGVLIVDNVIWSGRIFDEDDRSSATEAIREFNRRITSNNQWIASIIPIRDGLMVGFKK